MRVLMIDAFRADDPGKVLLDHAVGAIEASSHQVDRLDLIASGFPPFMTEEERRRYHDVGDNVCCPHVEASADLVRSADAVIFGLSNHHVHDSCSPQGAGWNARCCPASGSC